MKRLFLALFVVLASPILAQEICNNGIDDDGDGFIDCYDGDCSNDNSCSGGFLGNDANCEAIPSEFPQFTMTLDFASPNETTNHLSRMAIGDLDRDGMPEIVSMNRYTRKVFVLNGNDGSVKHEAAVDFEPYWEIAIGNIDNDACGEIFFIGYVRNQAGTPNGIYIFAYDCQLNFLWRTAERLRDDPINYGLADFDGDGLVELYAKDEIYDAHTGVRIVRSTAADYRQINGGPVAADIVGDQRQELILGLSIYQVNLGARTLDAGSLTLLQNRNEYFIRNVYNATSVADFNQDGFLDIIASGSTENHNRNTTIFFWDVQNNTLDTYIDSTSDYAPNGWKNGTGRVNISDLDGDGNLNLSYVSGKYLYALDHNLQLFWRVVVNEETSGYTGCTLFDFNGDGKSEIVYRDEQFLYIIDGTNGSVYSQQACISRTNREYPIVADVDADGSTELCVTCGFNDADAWANFNNLSYSRYAHVRVFKSASEPWVPARRLWNQHGYFVVNVNDDLSIPRTLQKHHLVFSSGSCTQGPNRPLNKFLNQAPYLNSDGCPTYASPDLAYASVPVAEPPTCPELSYTVSFDITNLGDVPLSGNVPITFYSSNPARAGAVKFNTISVTLNNLRPNDIFSILNATVNGNGSDSLYIVLNDAGTTVPTPISLPNTDFFECDYDNIIGIRVIPLPVTLTALVENLDEQCSSPPNGLARAFIPIAGGGENTADYNFYWSDGAIAKPVGDADFIGPIYSGLAAGTYTVYALHKTANCSSDTVQVQVDAETSILPKVTVNVLSNQTLCNPPNGALEAVVEGGNSGYTFEWEDDIAPIGVSGPVLNNRPAGIYRVVVTSPGGCQRVEIGIIEDLAFDPDVQASSTPITTCNDPNAGTLSAQALVGGVVQPASNYTFNWFFYDPATNSRGSQLPATHGADGSPDRTGLPEGFYEVEVIEISSGCPGTTTEIVEISNDAILPEVQLSELAAQTSCDPLAPNGVLAADVLVNGVLQDPSLYSFEWFVGQNTLPSNAHTDVSGVNGRIAENLQAGGQSYTVKVTNLQTQCVALQHTTLSENLISPVVTLTKTDNGICDPVLASSTFTGSITAGVSYNGNPVTDFTDYSFTWYAGSQATGTPLAETSATLSNLSPGYYTVVVTRNNLQCASPPATVEVENIVTLPVITANAIGSTNCLPLAPGITPNGIAQITDIDGAGVNPPGYSYQWFDGTDTTTPIAGATNSTLSELQGGAGIFFTVLVTNTNTGCQNTSTVNIPDNQELPLITLASTDNTICVGTPDGTASLNTLTYQGASINDPFDGYTFNWSNSGTTSTITALAPGQYSLVVTKTDVGCSTDPVTVQVGENLFTPAINITETNQTSCDLLAPNGSLAATIDETSIGGGASVTDGYTFTWENNNNPFASPGTAAGSTSSITNLNGNLFYTVSVLRTATGCTNTESVFLPEVVTLPIVAAATSNDVTRCDTPDGSVVANVGGAQVGYTFFWVNEVGNNQTANAADVIANADASIVDNGTYDGLIPGYYTVVARDNATSCISQPVTRIVQDNISLSNIQITTGPTFPTSCALADGQMSASITGGVGPFDLFWHNGGPINDNINFFNNPPQFTPPDDVAFATETNSSVTNITGLESKLYTLIVRDKGNGCGNYESVFLPFIDAHTVNATTIPSTICVNGNGAIEITVSDILPATNDFQDYVYKLYSGENPTPALQIGASVGPGGAVTDPVVFSNLNPGKYTIEVRQDPAAFTGSDCPVFKVVDVLQNAFSPIVSLQSISANTSCDMVSADGSVTIQINPDPNDNTAVGTYGVDISPSPIGWGGPTNIPAIPNTFTITGLAPNTSVADYTITVTANNCPTQRLVSIPNLPIAAALVNGNITVTNSEVCTTPAGSIVINAIDRVGGNGSNPDFTNLTNYQFTWFDNAAQTPAIGIFQAQGGAPLPGERLDAVSFPAIGPGSFWVVARKNAGSQGIGCTSAPFKADILDISKNPTFTLTPFANTSCDMNFEGSLQLVVTDPGSLPSASYTYTWDDVTNPIALGIGNGNGNGDGTDGDDDNPLNLSEGIYKVTVTNTVTGCSTPGQTTILKNATPIILLSANPTNQLICNPDGSITVIDILVGGTVDPVHTNFDFTWFADNTTSAPIINEANGVDTLTIGNYASIGAGTYFVKAKRLSGLPLGSGCESAPLRVEILNLSVNPDVSFISLVPNSSCDPMSPNGSIAATALERDTSVDSYTFNWTFNGGPLPGGVLPTGVSPNSQLAAIPEGNYEVTVTNTLTGCTFTSGTTLILNQLLSLPNIVSVEVTNPLTCNPDGSVRVSEITIGGTTTLTAPPDDIDTNFTYEWYKGSTLPSALLPGEQNSSVSNQLPDTYFVLVRNNTTNCQSAFIEAIIDESDIILPDLKIRQTIPQIVCDITTLGGSGALAATVDLTKPLNSRNNLSNYEIFWFNNLTASGAPINAASDTVIINLLAGNYSATARDLTTNCETNAIFIVPNDSSRFKPLLALASSPLTECDSIDGFITATGVAFPIGVAPNAYPFPYNYTADLYSGQSPNLNNPPDFVMNNDPANPQFTEFFLQPNLAPDIYTVRLTDNNTGCIAVDTVSIQDKRVFPIPAINTIAPVTNCNPDIPNGVARVNVNGSAIGYRFEWFEGNVPAGTPLYTGVEFNELKPSPVQYTIVATNLVTGCTGNLLTSIEAGVLTLPMPEITILSHVTSCIADNGALSASVGGITADYIFDWYDGTEEVPPPDFTGEIYKDLPIGFYSVIATSRITGCKSPLVSEEILEKKEIPSFEFEITNASCDEANGSAQLIVTSTTELARIEWRDNNGVVTIGPNLNEVFAGNYAITLTSILGCTAEGEVVIPADIKPYNGISRNGDDQNYYFHIDCIDNFRDNLVKIFNRAGTLVYEATGYDNQETLFDGFSNKGVSPMGTSLPDGTYYYIIDKRDGTKPVVGYLEIVN